MLKALIIFKKFELVKTKTNFVIYMILKLNKIIGMNKKIIEINTMINKELIYKIPMLKIINFIII